MKRRGFLMGLLSLPFLPSAMAATAEVAIPAEAFAFGKPAFRVPVNTLKLGRVIVSNGNEYCLGRHFVAWFPDTVIHGQREIEGGSEYLVSSETFGRELGPLDHIPLLGRY